MAGEHGRRLAAANNADWQVPYCRECLAHLHHARSVGPTPWWVNAIVTVVFGAIAFLSWRYANWVIFGLLTVTLALAALAVQSLWYRKQELAEDAAAKMCQPGCAGPGPAVIYRGWSGTAHTFEFTNAEYAEAFVEANPKKRTSAIS
jgi:hypothetical protein